MARTSIAPLPRAIEADPEHEAIRACLAAADRRLWAGATAVVPVLPLAPPLARAIGTAGAAGQLVLGLEGATEALASEERGLVALARRPGMAPATRVSRLLLLSQDGAERLYRQAERLATAYTPRLLVVMLACDAVALGRAAAGRPAVVRAVLARHKDAVAALLRAAGRSRRRPASARR